MQDFEDCRKIIEAANSEKTDTASKQKKLVESLRGEISSLTSKVDSVEKDNKRKVSMDLVIRFPVTI